MHAGKHMLPAPWLADMLRRPGAAGGPWPVTVVAECSPEGKQQKQIACQPASQPVRQPPTCAQTAITSVFLQLISCNCCVYATALGKHYDFHLTCPCCILPSLPTLVSLGACSEARQCAAGVLHGGLRCSQSCSERSLDKTGWRWRKTLTRRVGWENAERVEEGEVAGRDG